MSREHEVLDGDGNVVPRPWARGTRADFCDSCGTGDPHPVRIGVDLYVCRDCAGKTKTAEYAPEPDAVAPWVVIYDGERLATRWMPATMDGDSVRRTLAPEYPHDFIVRYDYALHREALA